MTRLIRLIGKIRDRLLSPEQYARKLGVKIGKNCFIATRNWSSEPYLIEIGDNVQVTHDVYFHTHGGAHAARLIEPGFDVFGKIKIEDNAYIGAGSHILPGVTIGKGSLIAAGSIVTKSIPPGQVWAGGRFVCTVKEYIDKNQKYNLNTSGLSPQKKKAVLLSTPEEKFIKK